MLILLAFVLLIFVPTPWNLWCFAAGLVLGIGELMFWNRTMRHRQPVSGAQTLIGAEGVALSDCRPRGQVRVDGAIWAADCVEGVDAGDSVRVVARTELVLTVAPVVATTGE
jgi:membrane protein implicated in regulation of membrane protease activity